jgi:WD40 repeat protein
MMRNRRRFVSAVLYFVPSLITASALAQYKPVTTVALPCESRFQDISPAGDQLYVPCPDHTVNLVSISSGAVLHTIPADPRVVGNLYSHDGSHLATALRDGTITVFPASGAARPVTFRTSERSSACAFSPDSNTLVIAPINDPGQVWDLRGTPHQVATLQQDFGGVNDCTFSPDGMLLVVADGDTVIRFYDTATWHLLHEYRGLKLETFKVTFTPDGKRILLGGADDHLTTLDLEASAARSLEKDTGDARDIAFFGTSGQAAILYSDGEGRAPPHISIWSLDSAKSTPLPSSQAFTGGGVVHGKLWMMTAKGKTLDIVEYQ